MKILPAPLFQLARRFMTSLQSDGLGGAFRHARQRLGASLKKNGLRGTLIRAFHKPPVAAPIPIAEISHPFDLEHGTDTGGYIQSSNLPQVTLSSLYTNAYFGISPSAVAQAIALLPIQPENFTFMDIGCGKGRALMVAAQFPFRQIVGVELVPELCAIARSNIARNPDWAARISVLTHDAATVAFPSTPLVLFMFHPFNAPVLKRVLANLERSLRVSPRETYLLYVQNPRFTQVLESFPFLREVSETAVPLSPEDAAAHPGRRTHESVTVYSANLPI